MLRCTTPFYWWAIVSLDPNAEGCDALPGGKSQPEILLWRVAMFILLIDPCSRLRSYVKNSPLTTNKPCSPLPHGLPPSGFRLGWGARSVPLHTAGTARLFGLLPHKNKKRSVTSPACPKNPAVFRYTTALRPPTSRFKVGLIVLKRGHILSPGPATWCPPMCGWSYLQTFYS